MRDIKTDVVRSFERRLLKVSSNIELSTVFEREIRLAGFDVYALGLMPDDRLEEEIERSPFLLINWPTAWLELYARQGFAREDILVAEARRAVRPFTWTELRHRQPRASERIFKAASDFGWNDGLLVPIRDTAEGPVRGAASLAARDLSTFGEHQRNSVAAISELTFRRALALSQQPVPTLLTARESMALRLVAQGLGDEQIGAALRISRATAHFHVENAKRALGATSRAQAVAVAITNGLLGISEEGTRKKCVDPS